MRIVLFNMTFLICFIIHFSVAAASRRPDVWAVSRDGTISKINVFDDTLTTGSLCLGIDPVIDISRNGSRIFAYDVSPCMISSIDGASLKSISSKRISESADDPLKTLYKKEPVCFLSTPKGEYLIVSNGQSTFVLDGKDLSIRKQFDIQIGTMKPLFGAAFVENEKAGFFTTRKNGIARLDLNNLELATNVSGTEKIGAIDELCGMIDSNNIIFRARDLSTSNSVLYQFNWGSGKVERLAALANSQRFIPIASNSKVFYYSAFDPEHPNNIKTEVLDLSQMAAQSYSWPTLETAWGVRKDSEGLLETGQFKNQVKKRRYKSIVQGKYGYRICDEEGGGTYADLFIVAVFPNESLALYETHPPVTLIVSSWPDNMPIQRYNVGDSAAKYFFIYNSVTSE